jgi:hypothetical protein
MKKLLLILLCVPLIGIGQGSWPENNECISGNCDNGYGKYIFWREGAVESDQIIYEGGFKNGKFDGKGNITCNFGAFEGDIGDFFVYGSWKNGKLDGNVIIVERSQNYHCDLEGWNSTYTDLLNETIYKYSGEYKDSVMHGFGFMAVNNFRYSDDNLFDETYAELYIGQWKIGMKDGFGRYLYANGDIYEGEWSNDKKEGDGKMIYNDGLIEDGIWEDDKYIGK